jgi:prevent-host-death family protein
MKTITVTELRTSLSKYVTKVKSGDTFRITERGNPIATIIPIHRSVAELNHLQTLEQAGLARIGNNNLPADFWELPRPKDTEGLALQHLLSERD